MKSNSEKLRMRVFQVWFLTLGVVLLCFAVKFTTLQGRPLSFGASFQSLQMMVGLIVPQIGVMTAFYLNLKKQEKKVDRLSAEQVSVITWLSVAYHAIFILTAIGGIVFYVFDRSADGQSLQRNTAAVVAIMGLFSIFLAPVAFLFAAPTEEP